MKEEHAGGIGEKRLLKMFLKDIGKIPLLSVEEEKALALRAREGDGAAINRLVEANLRFVVKEAFRLWRPGRPLMDMVAEGCLGLVRAARSHDPTKGYRFITYASYGVFHGILRAIADHKKARDLSLEDPLYEGDETGETLKDRITYEEPIMDAETLALQNDVRGLLDGLSEREKAVIMGRFWHEKTLDEVGSRCGLHKASVRQIEARALRKIRWTLMEKGEALAY
jgi:RNA polymerase sigma factor (sigma-70 family)